MQTDIISIKTSELLPSATYSDLNIAGVSSTAHGGRAPDAALSKPVEIMEAPRFSLCAELSSLKCAAKLAVARVDGFNVILL